MDPTAPRHVSYGSWLIVHRTPTERLAMITEEQGDELELRTREREEFKFLNPQGRREATRKLERLLEARVEKRPFPPIYRVNTLGLN